MISIEDRIKGSMYGFAVGDAMGATTEFMTPDTIKAELGRVETMIGGGWLKTQPGQITDDTQMMLCVAKALMQYPDDTTGMLDACCVNFIEWFRSKPIDIGNTCREVIFRGQNYTNYNSWLNIARSSDSLGNGSLMRILPVTLCGQSEALAIMQGMLTHNNAACSYYLKRYHNVLSGVLKGEPIPKGELVGTSGLVSTTYINALYWAAGTKTFKDAIIGAVNEGGDADTIAALTGGLSGAYHGIEAVPKRWINKLDPEVRKQIDEFASFATKMYVQKSRDLI